MKKLITLFVFVFLAYACSNTSKKKVDNNKPEITSTNLAKTGISKKIAKADIVSYSKTKVIAKEEIKVVVQKKEKPIDNKKKAITTKKIIKEKKKTKEEIFITEKDEIVNEVKEVINVVTEVVEEITEPLKVLPKLDESTRSFVRKKNKIGGNWSLKQEEDRTYIVFHSNFKTKKGPDLKVFFTNQSIEDITAKSALIGSVLIDKLKSNSGEQRYLIPSNVNISQYKTMIIHCEKYTILWGGGSL